MKKRMICMVTGAVLLGSILWSFSIPSHAQDIENSMLEIQMTPLQENGEEASEEIQESASQEEGIETTLNVSDQLLRESEEQLQEEASTRENSSKNPVAGLLPILGSVVLFGCVIGGALMFKKKK